MATEIPMPIPDLQGVARTLLVPLACRAIESICPDAITHDPRAVELYNAFGGSRDFLLGMSDYDRLSTKRACRARLVGLPLRVNVGPETGCIGENR